MVSPPSPEPRELGELRLERLRAELEAASEASERASLLGALGAAMENQGRAAQAASRYLAALEEQTEAPGVVESLLALGAREPGLVDRGPLTAAWWAATSRPSSGAPEGGGGEAARLVVLAGTAAWERAKYLQDEAGDPEGALAVLRDALTRLPEDTSLWLELERLASACGRRGEAVEALEARARLAKDPAWKALLTADLAAELVAAGEADRALSLLEQASGTKGPESFRLLHRREHLARAVGREEAALEALEGQAELVARTLEAPEGADTLGLPRWTRGTALATEAWLRVVESLRARGDRVGAASALERARERLPQAALLRAAGRIQAEAAGDLATLAVLARQDLHSGRAGDAEPLLWLRVAEAALAAGDPEGARRATMAALRADPSCLPARVRGIDLWRQGASTEELARYWTDSAEIYGTARVRAESHLLGALAWVSGPRKAEQARASLARAKSAFEPAVLARVARMFAVLSADAAWYEAATQELLASGPEREEVPSLWLELARMRVLRGDHAAASLALAELQVRETSGMPGWLGHLLEAYDRAPGSRDPQGCLSPSALHAVASLEAVSDRGKALRLLAARRRGRAGALEEARAELRTYRDSYPELAALVYAARLEERAGQVEEAAGLLVGAAERASEPAVAQTLRLEAAWIYWHLGDRRRARRELETVASAAPELVGRVRRWTREGNPSVDLEAERVRLEEAFELGWEPEVAALFRAGLEMVREPQEASGLRAALEALESCSPTGDLSRALHLLRLLADPAVADREAAEKALARLLAERAGEPALIAAERHRQALEGGDDAAVVLLRAAAWARTEASLLPALEWWAASLAAENRTAELQARAQVVPFFEGEARASLEAALFLARVVDGERPPLLAAGAQPMDSLRLANLEASPAGCAPERRREALLGLGEALGPAAPSEVDVLVGWNELAVGDLEAASLSFRRAVAACPADLAAWEGLRTVGFLLGDVEMESVASSGLAGRMSGAERSAELWERVARLARDSDPTAAERALAASFARDPGRASVYQELLAIEKARGVEGQTVLDLLTRRAEAVQDVAEKASLLWERARLLRERGAVADVLEVLGQLLELEPEHVGALALGAELHLDAGDIAEAALSLAALAAAREAPAEQKLEAGLAAVDLYDQLGEPERALDVLVGLQQAGMQSLSLRERLGRVAARLGAWETAVDVFEQLMADRDGPEGRAGAARLALAIWRDKLRQPSRAEAAVRVILEVQPDDAEAVEMVLDTEFDPSFRAMALEGAREALLAALAADPTDPERVTLLAQVAGATRDLALRQGCLGTLVALGEASEAALDELVWLEPRVVARPQTRLAAEALDEVADPEDGGPLAELFRVSAETLALVLGPSLGSAGVSRRDRIEARGGHPLRLALAEWAGAFGLDGDWELYIGGPGRGAVQGVVGEVPALVLGDAVRSPMTAASRGAIAREVFSLARGTTVLRQCDAATVACLVAALCQEAGVPLPPPSYAMWPEIARAVRRELSRKVRKAILEPCQRIAALRPDVRAWFEAARRSQDRAALLAAGDPSLVLADALQTPRGELGARTPESERAQRLLAFAFSPEYAALRSELGLEVS